MLPPIYYALLSVQDVLGNSVTPQLRAVTADIDESIHELIVSFFYDGEVSEELFEVASLAGSDINHPEYSNSEQIVQLDFPKKIPVCGKLAYLRYEPNLPEHTMENKSFLLKDSVPHAVFRLDMQEALLGKVTPALRHVSVGVDPDHKKLIAHFKYDGEISEKDYQLATAAIRASSISFPDYEMESMIERVDFPNKMSSQGGWLAYFRREFIY